MSQIDTIAGDLDATSAELREARTFAAAAAEAVTGIMRRTATKGFAGIAQSLDHVRVAVTEVGAGIATAAAAIDEGRAAVAAASRQPSPRETVAVLARVEERLATARDRIAAAITAVDDAGRLVMSILSAGRPGPMLAGLGAVRRALVEAHRQASTALRHANVALAEARSSGNLGNRSRVAEYPARGLRHPTITARPRGRATRPAAYRSTSSTCRPSGTPSTRRAVH